MIIKLSHLTKLIVCVLFYKEQNNQVNKFVCRYLDIFLGLLLLLSMLSLLYGSYSESVLFIIGFLALSLAVVIVYWCWYAYTRYAGGDYPVLREDVSY